MARRPMDKHTRERLAQIRQMRKALKSAGAEPLPYSGWTKSAGYSTPYDFDDSTPIEEPVGGAYYEEPAEDEGAEDDEGTTLDDLCEQVADECNGYLNFVKELAQSDYNVTGQAAVGASSRVKRIEYLPLKSSITCDDIKRLRGYESLLIPVADPNGGEQPGPDIGQIVSALSDALNINGSVIVSFHKAGGVVSYNDVDFKDFYKFANHFSYGMGVRDILEKKCSGFDYLVENTKVEKVKP